MACDDEIIPLQERIEAVADGADLEEVYNEETSVMRRTAKKPAHNRAQRRIPIDSVAEIPTFASDEEEVAFWETHEPSVRLLEGARHLTLEEMGVQTDLPER